MSPCHLNARCPRCTARTLTQLSRSAVRCDACGEALDELIALGDGVRAAFRAGEV